MVDIEAIWIRERAATEGPWSHHLIEERKDWRTVLSARPGGPIDVCEIVPWMGHLEGNAEFIAHAREDIPALLLEVARLRTGMEMAVRLPTKALTDAFLQRTLSTDV